MTGNYWCCHLAIIRPCLVHISVGLGRSHRGSNLDSALVGCYFFRCYMCIYYQPGTAGQLIFRVSVGLEFELLTSLWKKPHPSHIFSWIPQNFPSMTPHLFSGAGATLGSVFQAGDDRGLTTSCERQMRSSMRLWSHTGGQKRTWSESETQLSLTFWDLRVDLSSELFHGPVKLGKMLV